MKTRILASLLSILILGSIPVPAYAGTTYPDVYEGYKYEPAITFLTDQGIVNGNPDGTFRPFHKLNRAELLKILLEAGDNQINNNYAAAQCFPDVPPNAWYTKYVCFAKEKGIIQGYPDGTFKPGNDINLVEALKITLKTRDISYDATTDPWYKDIVDTASKNNFLPLDLTSFDEKINRGQMSDLITRVLKSEKGTLNTYLGEKKNYAVTYATLKSHNNIEDTYLYDKSVLILTETAYETKEINRTWPTVNVFMKQGSKEPQQIITEIGEVGEYPSGFMINPAKDTLYINLESKLARLPFDTFKLETIFFPEHQVSEMVFSKDGTKALIWDQVYAQEKYDYTLHLMDLDTLETKTIANGTTKADQANLLMSAWNESQNFVLLWEALGEATRPWHLDLYTDILKKVPETDIGFYREGAHGTVIAEAIDMTPEACNEFLGSGINKYAIKESATGKTKYHIGAKGMITEIRSFSPDNAYLLYEQYTPQKTCTTPPKKSYILKDTKDLTWSEVDAKTADAIQQAWNPESPRLEFKNESTPDGGKAVYYLHGYKIDLNKYSFEELYYANSIK